MCLYIIFLQSTLRNFHLMFAHNNVSANIQILSQVFYKCLHTSGTGYSHLTECSKQTWNTERVRGGGPEREKKYPGFPYWKYSPVSKMRLCNDKYQMYTKFILYQHKHSSVSITNGTRRRITQCHHTSSTHCRQPIHLYP
jgi:hypothetical protein